jgi:cytochrome c peroxidase
MCINMRLPGLIRPPPAWLLPIALAAAMPMSGNEPYAVGAGDVRDGYERPDYRTRSSALPTTAGRRLDLAGRSRAPPLGLPPLPVGQPPLRAGAVDLGRQLFFDRRLSANDTLSCGMCHVPEQGFTQTELLTPVGLEGRSVRRNAPALYNVTYRPALFRDGREQSLQAQVWSPLLADNEMGNASRETVIERVAGMEEYAERFAAIYPAGLTEETLSHALASYQRALLSGGSPFDRWYYGSDDTALGDDAQRGFEVFRRVGCGSCHLVEARHARFTDDGFHNTGVGYRGAGEPRQPERIQIAPGVFTALGVAVAVPQVVDDGRFEVTGVEADRRRYRTPSLRNVAVTAPYMYDGSLPTLAAVVDYYAAGGTGDRLQDPRVRPLALSAGDKADLAAFLASLTGSDVNALAEDARSVGIADRR